MILYHGLLFYTEFRSDGGLMSNFTCEVCGAPIIDSPLGYITECIHYPLDPEEVERADAIYEELRERKAGI